MDIETTAVELEEESMDIERKLSTDKIVKKPASKKPDSKKAMDGGIPKKMRKGSLSINSASKAPCKAPSKDPPKSPSTSPSTYPSTSSPTSSLTSPSAASPTTPITSPLKPSLKSPSDPSPDRHLHRPNGKFAPLIRMIRIIGMQGVQRCCETDEMDTDEDYEWNYPGFNGYLLEEFSAKRRQFPEMGLDKVALATYRAGEVNEYGIA
ncbi:predicted protein [Sclerotinia sclerotiorum 1980 UF-70]|uniref:Uncharacterized protein n=2 Tax=Sclerotinia sclerotiorum (strain ATCC 18683 / 1980 / Ss-1) TaxID=665079 RepID=A7EX14_SCLS1|nr:predicted protein [Sclerotinia sclerotiorum 1980 UF-70]APA05450.1 hypothetical protein sscle_01g002200 [Sclerotinia sclerotiorum 1980 UF-70]EDN94006.1 predicted protein [Sclerotinia sclerotiorum 1980 UF-70]